MPAEKRNKFLDADESDDDIGGYESEEELRKGSAKRRRVETDEDSDADDDVASGGEQERDSRFQLEDEGSVEEEVDTEKDGNVFKTQDSRPGELPGVSRPLTKKNLVASEAAIKKSGVIYISRVPPFMKPQKLRSLLEPYGTINRIFLSPEDPEAHKRRVRNGGNKKKSFTDGWVEFVKKKDAKTAVDLLRGRPIGGKKGSFYRDDMWSLSYLKGFKWHNLTEQITAEAAEKANRMRAEISRSTKENKEFVQNIERAKMLDGIQSKKKGKDKEVINKPNKLDEPQRQLKFEQATIAKKKGPEKLSEGSKRVASMLF